MWRSSPAKPCWAGWSAFPSEGWPTETYLDDKDEVFFNGEAIEMFHAPAAHTDGDSIVFFRRSDVIATGDLFDTDRYPQIDLARGGSLQGIIDGLNKVIDLAIPEYSDEGGTMVIPGHGRICDEIDVVEYRDMLTIVRDRLVAMIKKKHDARSNPGGAADARLRSSLRLDYRPMDHGYVCRGCL